MKYFLVLAGILFICSSKAQNPFHISISNTTLAATDSVLPFWFAANQHGKVSAANSFSNITDLTIGQSHSNKALTGFSHTWGGNFIAAFGKNNVYQLNQAFAGLAFKGWELKSGLFYDEIRYAGLSTSNGIIGRSENARPVPRIRFSTMGYKPFPFAQNWLSFKGEYEEGWLNDDRYVDGAHIHHKNLYLKFQTSSTFHFSIGFEHFAMWGGTSPNENIGEMPGWENYWRYVFALPGNSDFPAIDQENISGNQLGSYQLEVVKDFSAFNLTFYLSHPWEDNSGLNWHNWPDNILGLHLHVKNEKNWVTDVVYEFTNTRQQSVKDSLYTWDESTGTWEFHIHDYYFNHAVYQSGFTYQQKVMSSPLFFPVTIKEGISRGIESNRFFAHHLGVSGNLSEHLAWKGLLTYVEHLGIYGRQYNPAHKQVSALFEVQYIKPGFPVELGMAVGADAGNTIGNNFGFRFSVAKRW